MRDKAFFQFFFALVSGLNERGGAFPSNFLFRATATEKRLMLDNLSSSSSSELLRAMQKGNGC